MQVCIRSWEQYESESEGRKPMCAIEDKMVPAEWGVIRKSCDKILFDNQSSRGKTERKWNTGSSVDHKTVSETRQELVMVGWERDMGARRAAVIEQRAIGKTGFR